MTASNASARPATAPSRRSSPARHTSAREVCFVKYYQKGSTDIAADQMAVALRRRGVAARSIFASELPGLCDAILVFVKRIDLLDLWRAKRAGNRIVLDVQDTVVFKRGIRYAAAWDGIIFRSLRALEDFGRRRPGAVLIPQHWDERYRPRTVPDDRLRLGFLGDPRSLPFTEPIPGLTTVFDDWFGRAGEFNAHLSVRGTRREQLYKPNNKISTAAACNAVLLTSRDEAAREHLGDDYPFYTDPDREAVIAAIAVLERRIGGSEWRRALAQLAVIREETSLDRITDLYLDYLSRFGELRSLEKDEAAVGDPAGAAAAS
jgi:hypothetical protein